MPDSDGREDLLVRDLRVSIDTPAGRAHILRGVSFDVRSGEIVALAGESGSGKSTVVLSLLRLLQPGAEVTGEVRFGDTDVAALRLQELREFRACTARVIFQDPWSSLHPLKTVGAQLVESVRSTRGDLARRPARELAAQTLARVGIPDAASRLKAYPHEFSGGQLQRVMIAMALVASPRLLVCDEPTTALDVTTQAQILDLLRELNAELGLSIVIATHDLDVIADLAHRLVVMYGGRVVEDGPSQEVLSHPRHPYSLALLRAAPTAGRQERLWDIPGRPPSPLAPDRGCAFAPRCAAAQPVCRDHTPELLALTDAPDRSSACMLVEGYDAEVTG